MACGEASDVYVGIFRIVDKLVLETVSHLYQIVVYELEVKVI